MPIELEFDEHKNILKVTVNGALIPEDIASTIEKIAGSGDYPPNVDALWDLRKADFKSSDEDLWQYIIEIRKRYPERANYKLALIVEGEFSYGMVRMYQILSEGKFNREMMIFRTYNEAENWILESRSG